MIWYINWKGPQGRETLDELDRNGFDNYKTFKAELNRLVSEYAIAGMQGAYQSSRMCANWKES